MTLDLAAELEPVIGFVFQQGREHRPALLKREAAQVLATDEEQVERHETSR
jgi:hypothetical protein